MFIKAHAKINLYLDVVSRREDGYHNLDMIMLPIELHDSISVSFLPNAKDSYVTCDHVDCGDGKYNSITIMLSELRKKYKFKQNFNIVVHKEIPIRSGLGGGSSNAAAAMKAILSLLKLNPPKEELIDICKRVGADVPFCYYNAPAHVTGIGEGISPIKLAKKYHVVIIKPDEGLSTKTVFEESDKCELSHSSPDNIIKALESGDEDLLSSSLFNSLEQVSIKLLPEIARIKDMLKEDGFDKILMSGSGSAVFALTSDLHKAQKMSRKYDKMGFDTYLTRVL